MSFFNSKEEIFSIKNRSFNIQRRKGGLRFFMRNFIIEF